MMEIKDSMDLCCMTPTHFETFRGCNALQKKLLHSFHFSGGHVIANPSQNRHFVVIIFAGADKVTELLLRRFKPISVRRRHLSAALRPLIPQWGSRGTAVCKSGPLSPMASCQCATMDGSRATRTWPVLSWDSESRGSHYYHPRSSVLLKKIKNARKISHHPSSEQTFRAKQILI